MTAMIPSPPPRGSGGFTLVEIAVAMLVIAIGFTTVMTMFPVGLHWTRESIYQGTGLHNAIRLAKLAAVSGEYKEDSPSAPRRDGVYPVEAKYRLPVAARPDQPFDSLNMGADYSAYNEQFFPWLFEMDGFFYTIHYRVRQEDGQWEPTNEPFEEFRVTGTVAPPTPLRDEYFCYDSARSSRDADRELYYNSHREKHWLWHLDTAAEDYRRPRLVHFRVTAYGVRARDDADRDNPESAFRRSKLGETDILEWVIILGTIPTIN